MSTAPSDQSLSVAKRQSCRLAVIREPRRLEFIEQPLPSIAPGQVRVRLEGCGVCASNGPVWEGRPWFDYPREPGSPGHEGWGVIDEVGTDVTHLQAGQRVAMLSYHAFADYDVAEADAVVPLPSELNEFPAPGEPLGCAMNVFRRSDIQPGQKVAVVGIGFLGGLLVQLATHAGAEVIAISRRRWALDLAEQCGAQHCIAFDEPWKVQEQVQQIAGGDGLPRVIEAVGNHAALDVAGELVGVRGRLVIAGFHQDGPRQVNLQSWNWRGIDVINAHERDPAMYVRGIQDALDAMAQGRLDPRPLLTHTFPLEELDRALEMQHQRPDGFLKALVVTG